MTLISTYYQKYVDQLHSDSCDLVIKAAQALGDVGGASQFCKKTLLEGSCFLVYD